MIRDRLMVGRRVLTPLILVRIQVSEFSQSLRRDLGFNIFRDRLMVGRRVLTPLILVRIQVSELWRVRLVA